MIRSEAAFPSQRARLRQRRASRGAAIRRRGLLSLLTLLMASPAVAEDPIRLHWDSKTWIGDPLFVSTRQVLLIGRDGRLREFPGTEKTRIEPLNTTFEPFSATELRERLSREFRGFEISITTHYVVVHPVGQRDRWSGRFEELHTQFRRYFTTRGAKLQEPRYPLVAVVLRSRDEFFEYARHMGDPVDPSLVGYYSSMSNRIALYDMTWGQPDDRLWEENAGTIYHEAAHQAAFNTGIHHRFSPPPRWVSEGLGTLFESPAIWNPAQMISAKSLYNQRMLQALDHTGANSPAALDFQRLLTDDEWFDTDPEAAYSRAWALSSYLAERYPHAYAAYLQRTADKRPFQRTSLEERLAEWKQEFPQDLKQLEREVHQYLGPRR